MGGPSKPCRGARSASLTARSRGLRGATKPPRLPSHGAQARRFPRPGDSVDRLMMRYSNQDCDFAAMEQEWASPGALVPLSDNQHYRLDAARDFGSARYELCGLADGFYLTFGEITFESPQPACMSFPDTLRIYVTSSGGGEYVSSNGDVLNLDAPNAAIVIEPPSESCADATFLGQTRFICVLIHREALDALFAGREHELPPVLRAFLAGILRQTVVHVMPLSAALLRCLDDVHACQQAGYRRRLFLQSKALEIICHALEALEAGEECGAAEASKLTARGVLKAQRILAENFVTPPPLGDLAFEVGLSRTSLCTGFRQILGQSVFDYIHDLRMQQALALLNRGDCSITQIAYAVGYSRSSSFSVAVHRHFGASPSELRRRVSLATIEDA